MKKLNIILLVVVIACCVFFCSMIYICGVNDNISLIKTPTIVDGTSPFVTLEVYNKSNVILGLGSGFLVSENGVIVTCFHVVLNATRVKAIINSLSYEVEGVLYTDEASDLVLLKVVGSGFPFLDFGDTSLISIGDPIHTIYGIKEYSVRQGSICNIYDVNDDTKVIQITTTLTPGISGAPIFDNENNVIAVASFIVESNIGKTYYGVGTDVIRKRINEKTMLPLGILSRSDLSVDGMQYLLEGYSCSSKGEYDKAVVLYTRAIDVMPNNAIAYYNLGNVYLDIHDDNKAIEWFTKATLIDPNYYRAFFNLGLAYEALERYEDALSSYEQVMFLRPDFAEAQLSKGRVYMKTMNYKDAIKPLNEAIRLGPNNVTALTLLGHVHRNLGEYSKALEAFNQAIRLNPNAADLHESLGVVYESVNDMKSAAESYEKAILLEPNKASSHMYLGFAYYVLGDKDKAFDEYIILRNLDQEMANKLYSLIKD